MTVEQIAMARPEIAAEDIEAVVKVLRSGRLSQGPSLDEFERKFARYVGASDAAGICSGTAALMVALNAAGVRPGDEVITVSLSFVATANAITSIGAQPVFVDVRPDDLNMDPNEIEAAVTRRTKAIVPVHLFGQMADMEAICNVARTCDLPVVEDACEAIGARTRAGYAGTVGTLGAFGFYANKPLTTAEGGMVVSNDATLIKNCKLLRNQGRIDSVDHASSVVGYSLRLSELHASLGASQLDRLDRNLEQRRALAQAYRELLDETEGLGLPAADCIEKQHSWFTYPVKLPDRLAAARDQIRYELADVGIDTRDYFVPIHLMPYYRDAYLRPLADGNKRPSLQVTESESTRLLALPLYPGLPPEKLEFIACRLKKALDRRA